MTAAYPELEVLIKGLYCRCQVLTKPVGGKYPDYIAVNSLSRDRPGEFVATARMGCWSAVPLQDVINDMNDALAVVAEARDATYERRFHDKD